MAVVETERRGQVLIVRMNRPERLNALSTDMRAGAGGDVDGLPHMTRIWKSAFSPARAAASARART